MNDHEAMLRSRIIWVRELAKGNHPLPDERALAAYHRGFLDALSVALGRVINDAQRAEAATPSKSQEGLRDKILAERDKGNLVYAHIEGYSVVSVEDFVKQPVDGMLYDLNRGEEVSLSFITEKKWVNDFAVALVIRKLVEQRDEFAYAERTDMNDDQRSKT